jgi:pimeloyl-ACP methyl ester carboxylesterase
MERLTMADGRTPGPAAQEFDALPDARRVAIALCGHLTFVEAPEQFREAVLSFPGVEAAA